ncbi:MAG TPA: FAD-dependent oxidoreductase [Candidatus Cybelea sp.]|nr:FAD-dependent oxidoreductase [Candidatus Cybelea sp.]
MKSSYRVVVIGGGVVGVSVLYHLTKRGWTDVALIERSELTSGSTWHAAGGMHTINGDPNMSHLQAYTVKLYDELERVSGQACGIHRVGCLYLAGTEDRADYFKTELAKANYMDIGLRRVSLEEAKAINPLIDASKFNAAMFDPNDGHVDPSSVTNAYAKAARLGGAEIHLRNPVLELRQKPNGHWQVVTKEGTIEAEYVVNAAGLWAREVGRLAGLELPILPMEHQYIVTNEIPEVMALNQEIPMTIDFEGESYLRQEQRGLLIGTYEHDCKHWALDGTPPDFGHELLAEDIDRIWTALEFAMERFPCLREGGIKRVINGGMVFAPDGNPLIGPAPGLKNHFLACGVMAGFSQGGGVGLAVANWIVDGEPGMDVFAMDVARFGPHALGRYTLEKTTENYRRRFSMTFPNEELPAARPLKTSPIYAALKSEGAVMGAAFGWEYPLWFGKPNGGERPTEKPTYRRSNAFDRVAEEVRLVREGVGLWETSSYCKIEVAGPESGRFLDRVLTNKLPSTPGRTVLCPMLAPSGRILGDLTVTRTEENAYLLIGSGTAEVHYLRWLHANAPASGVEIRNVTALLTGFSITGPKARELLQGLTDADLSNAAFPFLRAQWIEIGLAKVLAIRASFTGELGFELYTPPAFQLHLYERLMEAGKPLGLRPFGVRALHSMRIEKGYGSWGRDFTADYNAAEADWARFVRLDKGDFIGRAAVEKQLKDGPQRRLGLIEIAANDIDIMGAEPIFKDGKAVARVTSGYYAHWTGKQLALGYLPLAGSTSGGGDAFEVEVLGRRVPATRLKAPPYDPKGERLRG